jgi:hypothetical protein
MRTEPHIEGLARYGMARRHVPAGPSGAVGWCGSGLIRYPGRTRKETDVIAWGASDHGAVERLLDRALAEGEQVVDDYVSKRGGGVLARLESISVRDGVHLLWQYGKDHLIDVLARYLGPPGLLLGTLPADRAVDHVAGWLEDELGAGTPSTLRAILRQLTNELFAHVKAVVNGSLKQYLRNSLHTLCAAAAAVSVATLLDKLGRDIGRLAGEAAAAVVLGLAKEMLRALATSRAVAMLVAIAVVVIILLLPEVIATVGAAAASIVSIGAALAELGPMLQELAL